MECGARGRDGGLQLTAAIALMKIQRSIHANFSALAHEMRDEIALVGETQLTYGELARRSDGIARYLARLGLVRGDRVGIFAQRSVAAVAAMLGILKAGGTYVPFDPSYPTNLLKFVYEDCRPKLMLVQPSLLAPEAVFWDTAGHELPAVFEAADDEPATASLPDVVPEDPAYIMYTSGSTGRPKGVLIPHRGVVRLVSDNPYAEMGPAHVHLQLAPLAFDASTFEIWGALLNGAKLAILSSPQPSLDDIANSIARHGVTTLWLTAGLFHLMVDHRLDGLKPLRQLLAGGDVLSPTHVAKAQAALPDCQLINGYGPTENTTFTCCYRIPRAPAGAADAAAPAAGLAPIPIGTPIAHTQVYILDESGREVAEGEEGELFAGGAGVALGYWNRPELTAEKFVLDPRNPGDGSGRARLYRTGDRVMRRPDGNIQFLGRVDRQVKINGKRVELDEIEAALRRAPAVEDGAVICPPGEIGARKIHAYLTLRGSDGRVGDASCIAELRAFLQKDLPDYMVPASFTVMEALPLSPTGKIDRAKLPPPQPGAAGVGQAEHTVAATSDITSLEAVLMSIWRDVLSTNSLGVNDNFFDCGGTSLQVIAVHARIAAAMKTDITVVDLFQYPSIGALAARLMRGTQAAPTQAAGSATPSATLKADERARRQQAALARARAHVRRNA
jgi:amino acid adenylation domain-containing protein